MISGTVYVVTAFIVIISPKSFKMCYILVRHKH